MKRIIATLLLCLFLIPSAYATEWNVPDDAVGIWFIPNLQLQQYVYKAHDWTEWQPIVDAEQSALITTWVNARSISDHCNSKGVDGGYWNMKSIRLGDSAYFITHEGKAKYQCVLTAIVDVGSWGFTIGDKLLQPTSSTDILCRCCVGKDAERNYVALFQFVKEIR